MTTQTHASRPQHEAALNIGKMTARHIARSDLVREGIDTDAPLIWAFPQEDRVILSVNPWRVKSVEPFLTTRFRHHLSTIFHGARVVVTNSRGIFIQVGYAPEPPRELAAKPLDLSAQPSPLSVPIGVTAKGDLWLSLPEMDAVLVGGARRMGKTNLLHGFIVALLQGKDARLVLFDGKGGVEFARYRAAPRCEVLTADSRPLTAGLRELFAEMNQRFEMLKSARAANLADYNANRGTGARLERIVLIVDELAYALQEAGVEDVLVDLIARGGAVGIHPVLATQRPSSDVITPRLKGNLVTRIALAVPTRADSMVILDRAGAEALPKRPGRLLITHNARLIEAQAFEMTADHRPQTAVVDGGQRSLVGGRLSDREQRLARAAIERGGRFVIREIADATGETLEYLVQVAQRWELLGWLTEVQRNERGHKLGRRITQALATEFGEQANLANLANLGEQGGN